MWSQNIVKNILEVLFATPYTSRNESALVTLENGESAAAAMDGMKAKKMTNWKIKINHGRSGNLLSLSPDMEKILEEGSAKDSSSSAGRGGVGGGPIMPLLRKYPVILVLQFPEEGVAGVKDRGEQGEEGRRLEDQIFDQISLHRCE